jgi:hypothetical protein
VPDAATGERIYRSGILADGRPLIGTRNDGVQAVGAKAACMNCHRASGMGGSEGTCGFLRSLDPFSLRPAS